jgi:peptide deformylase
MGVRKILTYPDPTLKQPSEPVEKFDADLHGFVADLEATMGEGPGAVGIAAPQVGEHRRIVIVDVGQRKKSSYNGRLILINPEIESWEGMEKGREGCLSVPDYTGNVMRAKNIQLKAQDPDGNTCEYEMQGFEARAAQHEIDHLNGMLFLDRLVSRRHDLFERKNYK